MTKKSFLIIVMMCMLSSLVIAGDASYLLDELSKWFDEGIIDGTQYRMLKKRYAGSNSVSEKMENGEIDWSKGVIRVKGMGAPPSSGVNKAQARLMSLRAAKVVAYRNLAEIVKGVTVSSKTTVNNFVTENDKINVSVKAVIKGARQVGDPKYFSDGSVEITLEMPMQGSGSLGSAIFKNSPDIGSKSISSVKIPASPRTSSSSQSSVNTSKNYTGLVVDARGLGLRPAMSPKLISESGKEVYGSAYVSKEFAVRWGMAGYAKTVDSAKMNDRVKPDALVIKGKKVKGAKSTDVVISDEDARNLVKIGSTQKFLNQCKVIMIID